MIKERFFMIILSFECSVKWQRTKDNMKDRHVKVIDSKYHIERSKHSVMNSYNRIWLTSWISYVYLAVIHKYLKFILNLKKLDYHFLCSSTTFIMERTGWINIFILIKDCPSSEKTKVDIPNDGLNWLHV